ncbi:MAG: pyruvate kinase alpha/beta domain-containing protein [Candidatus Thorarchaeota archaeon]
MRIETHYFDEASPQHTQEVLDIVGAFIKAHPEIEHIVVATTEGTTGVLTAQQFSEKHVVVVSHMTGFAAPNFNELKEENRNKIKEAGAEILTTTHALAGIARSFRKMLGTWTPTELMAVAFRTFGQGTKVCAEIAMMAADAGLVPVDEDVITIGGTGRGADTAWLVRPAYTSEFPLLKMRACLCKPREF